MAGSDSVGSEILQSHPKSHWGWIVPSASGTAGIGGGCWHHPAGDRRGWGGSVGQNPSEIPPQARREVSAPRPRGLDLQEQRSGPRGAASPAADSSWISRSLEVTLKLSKQSLATSVTGSVSFRGKGAVDRAGASRHSRTTVLKLLCIPRGWHEVRQTGGQCVRNPSCFPSQR